MTNLILPKWEEKLDAQVLHDSLYRDPDSSHDEAGEGRFSASHRVGMEASGQTI